MHSNAAIWSNVMKQKLKIVNDPGILGGVTAANVLECST